MDQTVPSRRALIVDDEFLIAFDLESSMRELGFDAGKAARWLHVCDVPIVFVTAHSDPDTLEHRVAGR